MLELKNEGNSPIKISEKQFLLLDGLQEYTPRPYEFIPREIQRFDSAAVLENIYNVSLVTIAFVGVLAAIAIASREGGGYVFPHLNPRRG